MRAQRGLGCRICVCRGCEDASVYIFHDSGIGLLAILSTVVEGGLWNASPGFQPGSARTALQAWMSRRNAPDRTGLHPPGLPERAGHTPRS